jgi:hypothetical protein
MITGHLNSDSTLRAIFTNGIVPLVSPANVLAKLGGVHLSEPVYLMDVRACSKKQREGMARRMAEMGQGSYEEAIAHINQVGELPIRASQISGVGIPLRLFT